MKLLTQHKMIKGHGGPAAETESATFLFWGLLAICTIEYVGMAHYIPGAQKIPLFLSAAIFVWAFFINNGREVLKHGQTKALVFLLLHTGLSMAWAVVGSYALKVFKVQVGYFILFILTYLGVRNIKKLRIFLASLVLYHCFIIVVNVDKLSSTARIGSFKAGYFLGDGNDFAWSLTIFLPFLIYLFITTKRSILRTIILSAMGMFIAAMVGTGSRGAFLALSASIVYLVFNSRKKAKAIVVTTALALLVFAFAPSSYMDRIHSIGEYQEDSSALGRMMAWKASMRMAVGHPLGVGAGNFNSAYGRFYRPTEVDPRIWGGARWISPHSVYFLVLGEYGVIGLVTLLTLLGLNFRDNQHQIANLNSKSVRPTLGDNVETLPKYLNMSLMAFAAGGAFLGGINYPHIYILTALILRTKKINEEVTQAGENLKPA